MASLTNKGAFKLQEFVAHSASVNCLALGHKSGQVLVTGGEDKKVNLWAVGKSNCIMSLSGHNSGISSVRFGLGESQVAAGSRGGALKIWDLEEARIRRSLSSHKAQIQAIDFHPFSSDMVTSASLDASVKLWDLRNKGCVFTYRGHSAGVTSVRFSPDGLWIASGGSEGTARVWDLRSGRLVKEFASLAGSNSSNSPLTWVEFHPHEFLLVAAARDSSIYFWDLEHFTLVSSASLAPSPPTCLLFSTGGECLYIGGEEGIRTQLWEPPRTVASLGLPWGPVSDMAASSSNTSLFGASYSGASVSLWVVDTKHLMASTVNSPNSNGVTTNSGSPQEPFAHSNPLRKSFNKQRPVAVEAAKKQLSVKTIEESERSETDPEDEVLPVIPNVHDYRAIFHPNRTLTRSPPPISLVQSSTSDEEYPVGQTQSQSVTTSGLPSSPSNINIVRGGTSALTPSGDFSDDDEVSTTSSLHKVSPPAPPTSPGIDRVPVRGESESPESRHKDDEEEEAEEEEMTPRTTCRGRRRRSISPPASTRRNSCHDSDADFPIKLSSIHHSASETSIPNRAASQQSLLRPPTQRHQNLQQQRNLLVSPSGGSGFSGKVTLRETRSEGRPRVSVVSQQHPQFQHQHMTPHHIHSQVAHPIQQPPPDFIPMFIDRPTGLQLDDFITTNSGIDNELSETQILSIVARGHDSVMTILESRRQNLQIVYNIWHSKDLKSSVETAVNFKDKAIIVDFLSVISHRPGLWNLDICVLVLPVIHELLQSNFETYMRTGVEALGLIVRNFSSVIRNNVLTGSSTALGVDISKEERYNKCMSCYSSLVGIRAFLLKRQTVQGPLGHSFRELCISLQAIDV